MSTDRTAWARRLAHVPDWVLRDELRRRSAGEEADQSVRVGGLVVDPVGGRVVWRGAEYALGGRPMQFLVALARAHAAGLPRLRSDVLGERVFRGWEEGTASSSVRVCAYDVRRRVPGLLRTDLGGKYRAFYRLETADEPIPLADRRAG